MSVETVLKQLGIRYRIIEDEAFAACPFHSPDRHPSWSVNIKSGMHYCFSCGAKGSLAYLIHTVSGTSYSQSVVQANEAVGHARMDKWREHNIENVSFSPQALKVTDTDMAFFTDPPAYALEEKHITLDAAKYYSIQWNPENATWIFPYRDPYSHELWGWQEKNARMFRNFPAGTKKSRTLFGYSELVHNGTAVIIESPVDCAVLRSAGMTGGVSSFGLPNMYQLNLLQCKSSRLIFCLDNDTPGDTTTRMMLKDSIRMFDSVKVFNYLDFDAKDIGELTYDDIHTGFEYATTALEYLNSVQG